MVKEGSIPKQQWFNAEALKVIAGLDLKGLFTDVPKDDPTRESLERVRQSMRKMLADVEQGLYLQMGPARLRHLHAEDPLVRQDDQGIYRFMFAIREIPEDRNEWMKLRTAHDQTRPVSITLAFEHEGLAHTLETELLSGENPNSGQAINQRFSFRIYSPWAALTFSLIYLLAMGLFCWFARTPNLLRDPDGPLRGDKHVFSLSRCQLAWWFFVILAAWMLLWVTTSSRDTLNQTALIVSGIGAATALSGAVAGKVRDSGRTQPLSTVKLQLSQRPHWANRGFGGWLYDLLSDQETVGFHRFQLLVWNTVLGVVFLWQTWIDFAMPEFNATLLGLLGLSAATFVGMKMTPNQ
jgi:hypothetical protein